MKSSDFNKGVVVACDVVAGHGEGTILREIIEECGGDEIYDEIMINGLAKTKRMAVSEYTRYRNIPKKKQKPKGGED